MADGEHIADRPATRREVDYIERGLQRQIDDQRRAFETAQRDLKEEVRRMGESVQKGMADVSLQVSRLVAAPAPPNAYGVFKEGVSDMKKSGTPAWLILLIAVGTLFAYLLLHKNGIL